MIVTTSGNIEGQRIIKYHDPITITYVAGANIFRDLFASVTDVIGGNSWSYQNKVSKINEDALNQLKKEAQKLNANGIIGLHVDNETVKDSMLMVTAYGTPVRCEQANSFGVSDALDELYKLQYLYNADVVTQEDVLKSKEKYLLLKEKAKNLENEALLNLQENQSGIVMEKNSDGYKGTIENVDKNEWLKINEYLKKQYGELGYTDIIIDKENKTMIKNPDIEQSYIMANFENDMVNIEIFKADKLGFKRFNSME